MIKSKRFGVLLADYPKGVVGSLSVSFTISGGRHCDPSCPLKQNGSCYAMHSQARQMPLKANLERKEADWSGVLAEVRLYAKDLARAPWVRFASFGSIPEPSLWSCRDWGNLRGIAGELDHTRAHFPVETVSKAPALRACGFFPRVSMGQARLARELGIPTSEMVEGSKVINGAMPRQRRREVAQDAIRRARAEHGTKVCPAILGSGKCGDCRACNGVDGAQTILYPRHV